MFITSVSCPQFSNSAGAVFVYFTNAVVTSGALVLLRGIDTEDFSQHIINVYHICELVKIPIGIRCRQNRHTLPVLNGRRPVFEYKRPNG